MAEKVWFLDTNVIVKEILARWRLRGKYNYEALLTAKEKKGVDSVWTSAFVISEVAGRLMEEYLLRKLWREGYTFLDFKEMREEQLAEFFREHTKRRKKHWWKRLRNRYSTMISNRIWHFIQTTGINIVSLNTEVMYWSEELLKEKDIREIPEATPAFITLILEAWGNAVTTLSLIPIKLADAVIIADAAVLVGPSVFLTTDKHLLKVKEEVKEALKASAEDYPDFVSTDVEIVDATKHISFRKKL